MNKFKGTIEKLTKIASKEAPKTAVQPANQQSSYGLDKYRKFHKSGPELLITRILMVNGALTSKQIWQIYQRMIFQNKQKNITQEIEYWPSLNKLKDTIKFMRINEKVSSNGYNRQQHLFKGWKISQKRALKYVHPEIIERIQKQIARRQDL